MARGKYLVMFSKHLDIVAIDNFSSNAWQYRW